MAVYTASQPAGRLKNLKSTGLGAIFIAALMPVLLHAQTSPTAATNDPTSRYHAIAAAVSDVAKQLGVAKSDSRYILYDPQIFSDLSTLSAYQVRLADFRRKRLNLVDSGQNSLQGPPEIDPVVQEELRKRMEELRSLAERQIKVKAPGGPRSEDGSLQASTSSSEANQTDVREALTKLFQSVGVKFSIEPTVKGTVTYSVRNVTFDTMLEIILRQVDATYRVDNGEFQIYMKRPAPMTRNPWDRSSESSEGISFKVGSVPLITSAPERTIGRSTAQVLAISDLIKALPGSYYDPARVPIFDKGLPNPLQELEVLEQSLHEDVATDQRRVSERLMEFRTGLDSQFRIDSFWKEFGCATKLLDDAISICRRQGPGTIADFRDDLSKAQKVFAPQRRISEDLERLNRRISKSNNSASLHEFIASECQRLIQDLLDFWSTYTVPVGPETAAIKAVSVAPEGVDELGVAIQAIDLATAKLLPLEGYDGTIRFLTSLRAVLNRNAALAKQTSLMANAVGDFKNQMTPLASTLLQAVNVRIKLDQGYRILQLGVETSTPALTSRLKNIDSNDRTSVQITFTVYDSDGKISLSGNSIG